MTKKTVTVTLEFNVDQEKYGRNTYIDYAGNLGRIKQGILSDDEIKAVVSDLMDSTGYSTHSISITGCERKELQEKFDIASKDYYNACAAVHAANFEQECADNAYNFAAKNLDKYIKETQGDL